MCWVLKKQVASRFGRAKVEFLRRKKEKDLKNFSVHFQVQNLSSRRVLFSSLFFDSETRYFCGLLRQVEEVEKG